MTAGLNFGDNTTVANAATFNKLVNMSHVNLLVGGSFESWPAGAGPGATTIPAGWGFAGNDGLIGRALVGDEGQGEGKYFVKIDKAAGDADVSRLYQSLKPLLWHNLQSEYYTFAAMIRCTTASKLRLYIQDTGSTPVEYSTYADSDFQIISLTRQLSASADKLIVGFEAATHSGSYSAYVDKAILVHGQAVPYFSINPIDRALQAYYWNNDGTYERVMGGLRVEPFKQTGTLSAGAGGDGYETIQVTLKHGCEKILYASADVISLGTTVVETVTSGCDNYGGGGGETTFDVNLISHVTSFTNSEAYELRGVAYLLGWDAYGEVFGE